MKDRIRDFIRAQTEVRWARVGRMTAMVLLAALLMGPLTEIIDAQQQTANVPTAATGPGMLITTTTTLSAPTATIMLRQGMPGTALSDGVTGSHNIYGYAANGAAGCYLQVFDKFPVGSITVGTTVPLTSLIVDSNSARGLTVYPLPLFSITSALGVAATTTPGGSTTCGSGSIVQFVYK